jgi:uncharacterized delta-60 repeat protein
VSVEVPPHDRAILLNEPAFFEVIASNDRPLTYQWKKDGITIPGATNELFSIAHSQFVDAGRYSVAVSDGASVVGTWEASLKVSAPRAGDVDYSFGSGPSIEGPLRTVAAEPDGKLVVAGVFTRVNGAFRPGVARLNADGSTDYSFRRLKGVEGAYTTVNHLAVQPDGKVLLTGTFTNINGFSRENIVRLNTDGSLDLSFAPVSMLVPIQFRLLAAVSCLALQADGKIVLGGLFTSVNGKDRRYVARLNNDGTLDDSFLPDPSFNVPSAPVDTLGIQNDGKVVITGDFGGDNGWRKTIARLIVATACAEIDTIRRDY